MYKKTLILKIGLCSYDKDVQMCKGRYVIKQRISIISAYNQGIYRIATGQHSSAEDKPSSKSGLRGYHLVSKVPKLDSPIFR